MPTAARWSVWSAMRSTPLSPRTRNSRRRSAERSDVFELVNQEPFKTLFDMQRIGRYKPNAPVMILSNRYDPLVPWTGANQLGRDWCAQGADVQFWTNEEPPFLNKAIVNHALPMLVDGERAMQWIADRFNGLPTTPNCGQF